MAWDPRHDLSGMNTMGCLVMGLCISVNISCLLVGGYLY